MPLRVIVPPEPFMTPADIPGAHAPDDAGIAAMIAAIVAQYDGPDGTLGRCFGPQTLELSLNGFWLRGDVLPCPPLIPDTVVVKYLDADGVQQTFPTANYGVYGDIVRLKNGIPVPTVGCFPWPVAIQYQAGYNGEPIAEGGTGDIPAQIKQAVILGVQFLTSVGAGSLFLKVDEVDGIGRREYIVSEQAGNLIKSSTERLLASLKVHRI